MRHTRFCHPRAKAHLDRYFDAMEQVAKNTDQKWSMSVLKNRYDPRK